MFFKWNELSSSQFLNPETQGVPRARFKYEVTASQVGKPLDFTVSYREGGVTDDLWLFGTNPDLMDEKWKQILSAEEALTTNTKSPGCKICSLAFQAAQTAEFSSPLFQVDSPQNAPSGNSVTARA